MNYKQLFTFILLFASGALAGPSGINLSGKISVQPTGTSLASADVDFRIRVLSPNGCVLYTERFDNLDLASSNGSFNLTIGLGVATFNAWDATPATRNSKASLLKLFSNSSPAIASGLTPYGAGPCAGGAYTPTADDGRQVVIELDPTGAGTPGAFLALSPYHQIRAVPYAMLADMASDSEKLGGVDAALYAKTADLTAAVPAHETDPTVEAFAKTALPDCLGTGKVLTANAAGVLSCVAGGAGSYTLPAATASALGGVIVGSGLSVAVDGTVSVSNTLTGDITALQTAVGNKVDKASMAVCLTNQVLVWQSPGDNFLCSNISITASQVSDFSTAVDARITAGNTASPKLPLAGGTMTGSITMSGTGLVINMGNNNLANVSYLHLENKTTDPVFSAGNNGYVWYNTTDKAIKFNDGVAIRSLAVGGSGGAPTGAAGGDLAGTYPNPTLKATGTAGTYVKVTTDAEGRVVSGTVLAATDIPSLDAAKIITGQFGDARISDVAVDKITSGASKYFTYAPNNVACNTGEVLKKTTNGWECGADAGSGGADASSIRGVTVDGVATAGIGKFMQHDGTKWTFVSMPVCTANKVLTFNATGIASCADIAGLVDANIAAGADIARSKLAAGTAGHVIINDGSGDFSSEAQLAVSRGGTGQSTYSNGQLLVGKTDGTLAKTTLTAGSGVTVTNGDGTITIAATGGGAPTGSAGGDLTGTYPNPTLVATGTAGTYTKVTTDAEGRVTVGASLAATDIPVLDAAKITTGTFADARLAGISVDKVTSGASKYFTYAPNNVACNTGEVLKKTTNGWECGLDSGAGGSDAISIRNAPVDGVATAAIGNYLQHDGTKWTFVSMPVCTANKVITFSVAGIATCTDIGGLVDSQIASGAAIARTKLANGTADHVLINNGSGVMSSEAQLSVSRGGTGQSTYTNGQILVGKTDGTLAKTTITAGSGVTVTNGDGTITIASTGSSLPGLTSANMWVGNGSGVATAVSMSGDATIDNAGALSIGSSKITSSHIVNGTIADTDISSSAGITRSKIASGTNYAIVTNNSSGVMGGGIACSTVGHVLAWTASGFTCQAPAGTLPNLTSANIWVGNGSAAATAVAPSGDVTMTNAGAFSVTKLQSRSVSSTTPTANQVLMYISSTWTPTSPTTTGAVSSLLMLDASGIATSNAVAIKGASTGTATIQAPNSFSNYSLTLPSDDGNADQVLATNGSGTLYWASQGGAPVITTKSADFTVGTAENNYFYLVSNTTNATLPAVASVPAGFRVTFKRMGGHNVNVNASGGETIDGASQRSLQSAYQAISVISTGSEWVIISGGAVSTSSACVPGSQSYSSSGIFSYAIDAAKATNCTFTITVQGAGGATAVSPAAPGGRGGAVRFTYTAATAGTFEMLVGGPGATGGGGGYGGGGAGGNAASNKGAGGGGASAIRFTTTAPTDTLLAIAGGGGGAGAVTYSNNGGDGGASGGGSNGASNGVIDFGRGGVNNVGGIAGTGTTHAGGAGGSNGGNGVTGTSSNPGAGGTAFAAFSVSGGGGGAGATTSGSGGGGGGYGGGGGGSISTNYGGGGGGGGYISPSASSFTNLTGPASGNAGSILIEWN